MGKQIYYVETSSVFPKDLTSILWVGTSKQKLKMYISKLIENEEATYYVERGLYAKDQAKRFREDFETKTRRELNNSLSDIRFDYWYDNEEV